MLAEPVLASAQRADIQLLRGLAVLAVVLYHTGIGPLPGGYLGVDVFFVISGFLITQSITTSLDRRAFSLAGFYFRRAKRLWPALYVMLAVAAVLALTLLLPRQRVAFGEQMLGALTFTSNIVLRGQTGYFGDAAGTTPLLHTWSLSVEEQFYLILPILLAYTPARARLAAVVVLSALSALAFLVMSPHDPTGAFYLLPSRAWELGLGALGALLPTPLAWFTYRRLAIWPALALIVALAIVPSGALGGGLDMALVCFAALILLAGEGFAWARSWIARPLVLAGDMSYSLYLVHWPIVVAANALYLNSPPLEVRLSVIALSLITAALLYRLVERPVWRSTLALNATTICIALSCTAVLAAVAAALALAGDSGRTVSERLRPNVGIAQSCDATDTVIPLPGCATKGEPSILIWGDSVAMHIAPGFAATTDRGIVQATRSVCGPFADVAPIVDDPTSPYNRGWAERCLAYNDAVLRYLEKTPSIKLVVLGSILGAYVRSGFVLLFRDNQTLRQGANGTEVTVAHIRATVDKIRALGRRVVMVAPLPMGGFDIGQCLERKALGLPILGPYASCDIPRATYESVRAPVLDLLAAIEKAGFVDVIRFDDALCDHDTCKTTSGDVFVYRDGGHFSYEGAIFIAKKLHLAEQADARAR